MLESKALYQTHFSNPAWHAQHHPTPPYPLQLYPPKHRWDARTQGPYQTHFSNPPWHAQHHPTPYYPPNCTHWSIDAHPPWGNTAGNSVRISNFIVKIKLWTPDEKRFLVVVVALATTFRADFLKCPSPSPTRREKRFWSRAWGPMAFPSLGNKISSFDLWIAVKLSNDDRAPSCRRNSVWTFPL